MEEHKECPIRCHHCGKEHMSTDYRCLLINEFRNQLIIELKNNPEKLPQNIQLFIPSQYRNRNDKMKVIQNKMKYYQQQHYDRNDQHQWPNLISSSSSAIITRVGIVVPFYHLRAAKTSGGRPRGSSSR